MLIALRPRHIDCLRRTLDVEETIIEVSHKHSPTGERTMVKTYPKGKKPQTIGTRQQWLDALSEHVARVGSTAAVCFAFRAGTPLSRNTLWTRIWKPAQPSLFTRR